MTNIGGMNGRLHSSSARARRRDMHRGEATRTALMEAAIRVFGRDGFHAATTKAIASEARANQALISYHFGGKEGLYRATIEQIVDEIGARIAPVAADVEAERRAAEAEAGTHADPEKYLELIGRMLDRLVEVLTADESEAWAKIIVREQQEPSPAFSILYERLQGRLLGQLAVLVARARGRTAPSAADRIAVLTIIGQVLVFRVARAAALRFMGWESLRPQETTRIKKIVRQNVAGMLHAGEPDA